MRGRAAVGKAPAPRTSNSNGAHLGRPARDRLADLGNLPLVNVAEELQRQVQVVRLDPFHVRGRARRARQSARRRGRGSDC